MKKRILSILLAGLLLIAPCLALADYDYTQVPTPKMFVCDADDTSQVFYERAADEQAYPASTTKIMTCILALEHLSLDQEVTVGEEILGHYELSAGYSSKSSLMGLIEGETVTVRDLLYGLMLVSGNDAADAIAVAVSGSVKDFVALMNEKAASLGMTNTHFVNPNGVQNEKHYTTARDIAKLTAYALKNQDFRAIVGTASYTLPSTNMHGEARVKNNTNKLLYTSENDAESCLYPYAIGVKTGDTPAAGKCLVSAAEKDGATVICVLYNDASDATYTRFHYAAAIFESVFSEKYTLISGTDMHVQTEFHADIANAQTDDVDENGQLTLTADVSGLNMRVLPQEAAQYSAGQIQVVPEVTWTHSLAAPIAAGTELGTVRYLLDGKQIYSAKLTCPTAVRETAILAPVETGEVDAATTHSLLSAPAATPQQSGGMSPIVKTLLIVLGVLVALLVILIVAMAIVRKKRREAARRRRRQQKLAQQRRMQQSGTQRNGSSTANGYRQSSTGNAYRQSSSGAQYRRTTQGTTSQRRTDESATRRRSDGTSSRRY